MRLSSSSPSDTLKARTAARIRNRTSAHRVEFVVICSRQTALAR